MVVAHLDKPSHLFEAISVTWISKKGYPMDTGNLEKKMDRRSFLLKASVAGLTVAGMTLGLTACSGGDDSKPAAKAQAAKTPANKAGSDPCNDLSGLNKDEVATRTTFKYVEVAEDPAKVCTNCNFWEPPIDGAQCGGCTLVKGPIHPGGGCMSWVAIQKA